MKITATNLSTDFHIMAEFYGGVLGVLGELAEKLRLESPGVYQEVEQHWSALVKARVVEEALLNEGGSVPILDAGSGYGLTEGQKELMALIHKWAATSGFTGQSDQQMLAQVAAALDTPWMVNTVGGYSF